MSELARELTVGQQALWLLYRLASDSPAYNVLVAVRLRGPLDVPALARSVTVLAERHPLTRCRFVDDAGRVGWVHGPPESVRLDVRDMPDVPDAELYAQATAAYRVPFRLTDEAPLRVVLLRRAAQDAVLLLVAHHLVTDATSQWILLRDLLAAYRGVSRRGEPDWQPLTHTYEEYAEEERRLLASSERDRLAEFWHTACQGAGAGALVTDRPRPHTPTPSGATCELRFPGPLVEAVGRRARELKVTPFALLLGAFQALLNRYTGQRDFLVGCPSTVRLRHGMRDVVGHFVNTLPLRAMFQAGTTVRQTVSQAHRQLAAGMAHLRYPCALLAPSTRAGAAGGVLFHTAVTMVGAQRMDPPLPMPAFAGGEGAPIEYAGLRVSLLDLPQQEAQLDLLVELVRAGSGLRASFRYNADLFDEATVLRLGRHLEVLVEAAVADPDVRVLAVPMVDESELAALLALGTGNAR